MVKEICNLNLLSIFPKYYITLKSSTQEKNYIYTFLVPRVIDKPIIKVYLTTLFNRKINSIKVINLKHRNKDQRLKKVLVKFNRELFKI